MNLFEILKQFKTITPDPTFSEISKRAILAMNQPVDARTSFWSARRTLLRIIETGMAVALTGFFVVLITGGLSNSNLTPIQYGALDPQSLRAEAQAIDIQIQLANLNYPAQAAESTAAVVGSSKQSPVVKTFAITTSDKQGQANATTSISIR